MHTEKIHIMTTKTTWKSVISHLCNSWLSTEWDVGESLNQAVESFPFSRIKKDDGIYVPHEETNGLSVLGVPIGSVTFCNNLIMEMIKKAISNINSILNSLEINQTIIQLFNICTIHKMS